MKPQLVLKPKIESSFRLPEAAAIEYLNVHQIVPNPFSSRRTEEPESLAKFANHLVAQGLIEPITVRVVGHWSEDELPPELVSPFQRYGQLEKYEIICGWRRWSAIKSIGVLEIEANIYEQNQVTDADSARMSLSENLLRQSLNPIDEVAALVQVMLFELEMPQLDLEKLLLRMHNQATSKKLKSLLGEGSSYSHRAINYGLLVQSGRKDVEPPVRIVSLLDMYGINLATFVTHKLPLLKLPADLLADVASGVLSPRRALLLAQVKDEHQRRDLVEQSLKHDYSRSKLQQLVQQLRTAALPQAGNLTTLPVNSRVEVVDAEVIETLLEPEPSSVVEIAADSQLSFASAFDSVSMSPVASGIDESVAISQLFLPVVQTCDRVANLAHRAVSSVASASIEGERWSRFREWLNECNQQSQQLEAAFNRGLSEFGDLIETSG